MPAGLQEKIWQWETPGLMGEIAALPTAVSKIMTNMGERTLNGEGMDHATSFQVEDQRILARII